MNGKSDLLCPNCDQHGVVPYKIKDDPKVIARTCGVLIEFTCNFCHRIFTKGEVQKVNPGENT